MQHHYKAIGISSIAMAGDVTTEIDVSPVRRILGEGVATS